MWLRGRDKRHVDHFAKKVAVKGYGMRAPTIKDISRGNSSRKGTGSAVSAMAERSPTLKCCCEWRRTCCTPELEYLSLWLIHMPSLHQCSAIQGYAQLIFFSMCLRPFELGNLTAALVVGLYLPPSANIPPRFQSSFCYYDVKLLCSGEVRHGPCPASGGDKPPMFWCRFLR